MMYQIYNKPHNYKFSFKKSNESYSFEDFHYKYIEKTKYVSPYQMYKRSF